MRPGAGRAARLGALVGVVASCSAAPPPGSALPLTPAPADGADVVLGPARYLVGSRSVVEHTGDGLDRVVVGGRRLELRGLEIVAAAPAEPDVEEGARAPAWAVGAPARYVFWKGKQLWGAETFMGPLHRVAALPAEPRESFDWLDGTGLVMEGGALVAPPSGDAPHRTGVPALARALAGDARRGVAVSALGHTWLTLDGGASYRDVSADLGGVIALEARGDSIRARLAGGRERLVTAAGAIVEDAPGSPGAPGERISRPPSDPDPDPFTDATSVRPLDAALRAGVPLADGGVVIAANGFVGRLDVATLRSTSVAALDPGLRDAECTPVRSGGSVVLACIGSDRAAVVDLDGPPRTERTFDLAGASDLVRFAASGDAFGYLGACDGTPPRVPDDGAQGSGEEPFSTSRERTPVFCVRVGRDEWVEHHLGPTEAADLLAWIPRVAGGAVALLARPVPFLEDRERVSARGALRVVRLGRTEPPLQLTPYAYRRSEGIDQSLRVLADDTVVGFLPSNGHAWGALSVAIDPGGHVHAHDAPPLASQLVATGRFALTSGDDGRLWESTDSGRTWAAVEPPPSIRLDEVHPSSCSAAGCAVGGFARLGWGGAPERAPVRPPMPRERYRRPLPAPPLVRLACAPTGPPTGRRIADSGGFGYTPQPVPRSGVLNRVGALGVVSIPWLSSAAMPTSGDIDMAWLAPLDVAGVIHRLTLPIAGLGISSGTPRPYDLHVGYLLEPDGGLEVFAAGPPHQCLPGLLETAGVTRPLGACALDASVGVDLGGRVVVVRAGHGGLDVSVAEAPPGSAPLRGAARGPARAATVPVALHLLHQNAGQAAAGFFFGAGARRGEPVVVVVDGGGGAALAPIDAARGTVGAEERLRPLTEAKLGSSPACARGAGHAGDEARVVLPFEGLIGIDRRSIPGVGQGFGAGVAVLRWSRERACLDAVEVSVHDDRYDESPGPYEPHGGLRKIVARFDGKGQAGLILVGMGTETRQPLACTGLASGPEAAP